MMYLSKGIVREGSTEQLVKIAHEGIEFTLHGAEAALWLEGRMKVAVAETEAEKSQILHLHRMGLAEYELEDSSLSMYRILCRCILVPAKESGIHLPLTGLEKEIMLWLRQAGLRLSIAELVYLIDCKVALEKGLLGRSNRQALVERIYTRNTIQDHVLECQMEHASERDAVVQALLRLLAKKKLLIL